MWSSRKRTDYLILQIVLSLFFLSLQSIFTWNSYNFVVHEAGYTRLCSTKNILTVNGQFPGPTIRVRQNDTIFVNVYNRGRYNITLHWHGVKQPRNPWADGPQYITQCPIQPGGQFRQRVIFAMEVGTIWWHAHSDWLRATVHGAIIVYPKEKPYPFPTPDADVPIILAEWWKSDILDVYNEFVRTGGEPNTSDAITINGQPGDLYPCSQSETFRLSVDPGKSYLLRIVNAAMNTVVFFSVANHNLTVVGSDGSYTKPLTSDYVVIAPGQSMDALLYASQTPDQYYMAARAYEADPQISFDNTTATAILQYTGDYQPSPSPPFPSLPYYNDSVSAFSFMNSLRSLANDDFPADVPLNVSINMVSTVSINSFPCPTNDSCAGPNGTRLAASMTNISFLTPGNIDILEAYYYTIQGVYNTTFPDNPPLIFNFTADSLPLEYEIPDRGTRVRVLPYGAVVEIVFQGTNLFGGIEHPMHLHGFNFYVVGNGTGNFDSNTDPLNYNLVDPPRLNTVTVPRNGWSAIRFSAQNPGVWFMHCHFDRHLTWGMETVFIVTNGRGANESVLSPPPDMPLC